MFHILGEVGAELKVAVLGQLNFRSLVFDMSVKGCLYVQYPCKLFCGSGFPGASLAVGRKNFKVCGYYSVTFLNQTLIFDWCVVW